jgi:hypothetical protein
MNEDILNQLGQPSEEPTEEVKVEDKKKSSGKPLDDEVIASMMANGDNTKGMFEPDESEVIDKDKKEKLHEDPDEKVKLKTKGDAKPSEKYATEFQKDMIKNPENYFIQTPKGKMSLKEAKEKGYDPVTKRFRENLDTTSEFKKSFEGLNDKDKQGISNLLNPSNVGLAPADAQAMGLKADSPMINQGNAMEQSPAQVATPMSTPTAGPAQAQGAPDINAILGGKV